MKKYVKRRWDIIPEYLIKAPDAKISKSIITIGDRMLSIRIKMNELSKVYAFAELAQGVQGDILVQRGRWCVDGKSALGLLALDMSQGALVIYPEDAAAFEQFIKQFEIKY